MRPLLILFGVLLTVSFPAQPWCQSTPDGTPNGLTVDFLNAETRSVSIPLGADDGVTEDLFFALLDDTHRLIAEVIPFEILQNRFWSGPLDDEAFSKVRIGTPVVRITLPADEAFRLKAKYRAREAALKKARMDRKRARLEASMDELDDEILNMTNRRGVIRNERLELQGRLEEERGDLAFRLAGKNAELEDKRDTLRDLQDERTDLFDQRRRLQERSTPPMARLERLDARIASINADIRKLWESIRKLREEKEKVQEDAERRGISRIKGGLADLAQEDARVKQELDDLQRERRRILLELGSIREGDR